MHKAQTIHVFPDDHYDEITFTSNKEGLFEDKSIGFLSVVDSAGDECHLPNVKASAVVKFFAEFIEIEDVLRERDNGNRATTETMDRLKKIKTKLDKWFEEKDESLKVRLCSEED